MSRLRLSLVLVALLAATTLPAPTHAAPTHAAAPQPRARHCVNGAPTKVFKDPAGDATPGIDITALAVWNKDGDRCYWTTVVGDFSPAHAQVLQVFYDTDRTHAGPEWQVFTYSPRDSDGRSGTYVVHLTPQGPRSVKCAAYRGFLLSQHQIRLGVVKSCFGSPVHVRVRVQLFDITKYLPHNRWRGTVDQVPAGKWTPVY